MYGGILTRVPEREKADIRIGCASGVTVVPGKYGEAC